MQQVKVGRSGSGQLYIYIPKFIENHFGMQAGQKVWLRIEGNEIRISFEKPKIAENRRNGCSFVDADGDVEVD